MVMSHDRPFVYEREFSVACSCILRISMLSEFLIQPSRATSIFKCLQITTWTDWAGKISNISAALYFENRWGKRFKLLPMVTMQVKMELSGGVGLNRVAKC